MTLSRRGSPENKPSIQFSARHMYAGVRVSICSAHTDDAPTGDEQRAPPYTRGRRSGDVCVGVVIGGGTGGNTVPVLNVRL